MPHKPFVYFGTPYVARDTLAQLVERGFTPTLVVTSPDAPKGRGMTLTPCETKEWALAHGLQVFSPEKLTKEARAEIASYGGAYAIVVAYGHIFPQSLIDTFPQGALNIHYSLLPKYRGASPVEAALLNNEQVTGVAIQQMVLELDAGDVLALKEVAITPDDTTRTLRPRLISEGAELLASILPSFEAGTLIATPQDASQATFCTKIVKSEGELSIQGDAQTNWNKYRAYAESPGTYFFVEKDGKQLRVKIREAVMRNGSFSPTRVVPEGKKEMAYEDMLRGGYRAR